MELHQEAATDPIVDDIMHTIGKLRHSKTRVPYTYHHDHLRIKCRRFARASRGDVSELHTSNKQQLYSIALVQLLDELGSDAFKELTAGDLVTIQSAKKIADLKMAEYNRLG